MKKKEKNEEMKRVFTLGTFDLLHYGHINFLKRAKSYGDYLIVGLSSDDFVRAKNKEPYYTYDHRKIMVEAVRYVDETIREESFETEIRHARTLGIDVFVMGDDYYGKFDHLKDYGIEVVYLPRTEEGEIPISTRQIKEDLKNRKEGS